MMTGEIEYNDLYYPQKNVIRLVNDTSTGGLVGEIDEEPVPQFFPLTAHAVLTVFIIIVAIIIMNLLFGMAVSDVQVSLSNRSACAIYSGIDSFSDGLHDVLVVLLWRMLYVPQSNVQY